MREVIYFLLTIIFLDGCIEQGYTNQYGKYTPKKPQFKLKDKSFIFPNKLDTINIYKLVFKSYLGKPEFSIKDNIWGEHNSFSREVTYIKFYPNGRCSSFNIRTKLGDQLDVKLENIDLNANFHTKGYYYYDGKKIQVERFVYGEGNGRYLYFNYYLNNTGDTLKMVYDKSLDIYIKEKIPSEWKKYRIEW